MAGEAGSPFTTREQALDAAKRVVATWERNRVTFGHLSPEHQMLYAAVCEVRRVPH